MVLVAAVLAAAVAPGALAIAGKKSYKDHPGYVSSGDLIEYADAKGLLVEITLHGKVLELLTRRADRRSDGSLARILGDLKAMNAIIADVKKNKEEAHDALREMSRRAERGGWEQFVRVREPGGGDFTAYVHIEDGDDHLDQAEHAEHVDGLLVIGFTDDGQMLFVNLVGRIDMEQIALLGERMGVPGLDDLPPKSEVERRAQDRDRDPQRDRDRDRGSSSAR